MDPAVPAASRGLLAAEAYEAACRRLCISCAVRLRNLLRHHSSQGAPFSTSRLSFNDAHAVALGVGLLVWHGASSALVDRFLAAATGGVSEVCRKVLSEPDPLQHAHNVSPVKRARPRPWLLLDFAGNDLMSSEGASALLAAVMLLPRNCYVEVALDGNKRISSLSLRPWLQLLATERRLRRAEGVPHGALVGLRLDSCPVRSLDVATLRGLRDLRWISLRYTSLSNICRATEILKTPPCLIGAALTGTLDCARDAAQLQRIRAACRRALSSEPNFDDNDGRTSLHTLDAAESVAHREALPAFSYGKNGALGESGPVEDEESRSVLLADGVRPAARDASRTVSMPVQRSSAVRNAASLTPVTLLPQFLEILLSNTPNSFIMFDDLTVSSTRRQEAKLYCSKHYELHGPDPSRPSVSLTSLLRRREEGLSSRVKCAPKKERLEHRQKKRRRAHDGPAEVLNLMSMVTAAGFPAVKRSGRLNAATGMQVALAAASSNPVNGRSETIHLVDRVQESGASASEVLETSVPPCDPATELQRHHRKFVRSGLEPYRERDFEAAFSSLLMRRSGAPQIRYLDTGGDVPRQFEYNPANPSELVYGTEYGQLVVIDHETGRVRASCVGKGGRGKRVKGEIIPHTSTLSSIPRLRCQSPHSHSGHSSPVYGLSWLNQDSGRFLSGTNDGSIHIYDVERMSEGNAAGCAQECAPFENLTSIHANCDDTKFAVSGFQLNVGLYDMGTGRQIELMRDCHTEEINVIKFAHRSPHVLVTSSFDRCVKKWDLRESRPGGGRRPIFESHSRTDNVMACFSPDDSRLLVSAVDNEVRQFLASDGRLEHEYGIPKTGSKYNYTRSYYMNDGDYIITGSCTENVVRVYNAYTGAFFTEVDMDDREANNNFGRRLNVQSLRANPGRRSSFSVLLAPSCETGGKDGLFAKTDLHVR